MPLVLGGGIGGLSAAYYLLKKGNSAAKPILFEAGNRLGGWIQTNYPLGKNSIRFESGPRTLRPNGDKGLNTLELCDDIGLANEILPIKSGHPAARNRLLAVNNELYPLPTSIWKLFKTIPPFSKPLIHSIIHDYKNTYMGKPISDDSTFNFIERRFGTEVAEYLVSAMICGICAGDAKKISVKFLMKDLFEAEQTHGTVVRGLMQKVLHDYKNPPQTPSNQHCDLAKKSLAEKWSIYSMNDGLETLPKTLAKYLRSHDVQLNMNSKCENVEFTTNGVSITANGKSYESDCLISSLPAFEIGKLLHNQHPTLANDLMEIPYVNVVVINLHFDQDNLLKLPAFGFLVPPSQNLPILGVIYDSCCFDMDKNTVLTVMMGGQYFEDRLGTFDENVLYEKAIQQIKNILKIEQKPTTVKVNILRQCIPQYVVGHSERVERIINYINENEIRLRLCGAAYNGVGVNDVIYSAKEAVESITY